MAKQLGISYAEACTGFEFKKQRAIPVITGIVVASENTELVMVAYKESAAAAEERERRKREEKALKRWAKLINGMRVRERLRDTYGGKDDVSPLCIPIPLSSPAEDQLHAQSHNPLADPTEPKERKTNAANVLANAQKEAGKKWEERQRSASRTPTPDLEIVKQEIEDATRALRQPSEVQAVNRAADQGEDEEEDEMEEVPLDTVPPDVEIRDFALDAQTRVEGDEQEEADDESTDAEMEEFDHAPLPDTKPGLDDLASLPPVPVQPSKIAATVQAASSSKPPPRQAATRQTRPKAPRRASIEDERAPERVQPRRAARQAVKVVDNPYEESSEDDEKAYTFEDAEDAEDDGDKDDQADSSVEGASSEPVIEAAGDADGLDEDRDEADVAEAQEPHGEGVSEEKPVRSIRLRIKQPVKQEQGEAAEGTGTGGRVTRSSKRKR